MAVPPADQPENHVGSVGMIVWKFELNIFVEMSFIE